MPSLKDIRNRIGSVKNTRQITRAMKLVAGAKLRRATDAATAAKPYQETLSRVLNRVAQAAGDVEHPLLRTPDNQDDVLVIVFTSDRGLCGGFNNALCRKTVGEIDALVADGKNVRVLAYGRKGRDYFQNRGYTIADSTTDLDPDTFADLASDLVDRLIKELEENTFSSVLLAANEYRNVMSQEPVIQAILPMKVEADDNASGASIEYDYEPNGTEILSGILPMALKTQLFQAFLEKEAGEQAARMTAMDSATRNASDLIQTLTLEYNRARQAAITKELIEIVSGAEAL